MNRAILTLVMLVLMSKIAFAECSGVTCQLVTDGSNFWYECNGVRITQIAELGVEDIYDFQVIDDRAVWCFATTMIDLSKAYYSNSVCGDESSIIRITQLAVSYDLLDHFQIVGDRAIWRHVVLFYDNIKMEWIRREAYYFNSFHDDGAHDGGSAVRITQPLAWPGSGPWIYDFQARAGGRPNRVVWKLDPDYGGGEAYYYTCLPGGGGLETGAERITQKDGAPIILSFNVNGDIATWYCLWGDGQVTNHSKTLLRGDLISCNSAGVEKTQFSPGEDVYVKAEGLNIVVRSVVGIWIQPDAVKCTDTLVIEKDPSSDIECIFTDHKGSFGPTLIWSIPPDFNGPDYGYDIIADKPFSIVGVNKYSVLTDTIDSVTGPGITVGSEPNAGEPNLSITLVYPTTDINVPQNEFFEFTVDVNCTDGDCGDVEVGLNLASEGEWTAVENNRHWLGIAMSSDGKYQTATVYGGQLYISSDYGATWTAKDSNRNWYGVAMSSTGQYQTAVVGTTNAVGQIYISSDYGNTWTAKESNRHWMYIALSSTGQYQTATVWGGQIYISSDYGATWTAKGSNRYWCGIAMSSTGQYQTATVGGILSTGQIYISSDYGNTWSAKESNRHWCGIAMSSDGSRQTAVVVGGKIYISSDYGATWTAKDSNRNWYVVAISSTGQHQTAIVYNSGQIYISSDYGNTWTAEENNRDWRGVAMSADGSRQTAVVYGGQIYVIEYASLLSTNIGDIPFYTTDNNPRTINLNRDQSQLVTWHINATGPIGNTYEFYAYANMVSDPTISDTTETVNVTITGIDFDGDGVAGSADNCPYIYNPGQEDSDEDGIGDAGEYAAANIDGLNPVDFDDLVILADNWLSTDPDLEGDTNRDWIVNFRDFAQMAQYWLADCNQP